MSTYAIGDIQGCYDELLSLLVHIHFDECKDTLWFTGDLVNRGPKSVETLRFIKQLGKNHVTILGNHDLHLLAVALAGRGKNPADTLDDVLNAPDQEALLYWLRQQPLLHYDLHLNMVMTHAGLAPQWQIEKAQALAFEVETVLKGETFHEYLANMYGNSPSLWEDSLAGMDRLRCITNYLTRMRYCYPNGALSLHYNGKIADTPSDLLPWYAVPNRLNQEVTILFGHWASLEGKAEAENVFPLDTGCVWGNCLTALRLEDKKFFRVPCKKK